MGVISDKKLPVAVTGNPSLVESYSTDDISYMDYSPFGMQLTGRVYNNQWQKYRYGFNGKENDNEMYGPYNELDYGMRIYDPRLGRFLSVDPLTSKFPMLTPYQYASNSPIENSDLDGLESLSKIKADLERQWRAQIQIKNSLDQRVPNLINSWRTSENQYSSFQFGATPQYSPEMKERKDAEWRAYLRNNGYNDDASKPRWMKMADDKTFNKFADNIALPLLSVIGPGEIKALANLFKYSVSARASAIKMGQFIVEHTPKGEIPRAVSVIIDRSTGKTYYGISGGITDIKQADDKLRALLPNVSNEKWPVQNCAECDALNKALIDKAHPSNLEMHTIKIDKKTGTITDFERCENCKVTTKDVKTTSDK